MAAQGDYVLTIQEIDILNLRYYYLSDNEIINILATTPSQLYPLGSGGLQKFNVHSIQLAVQGANCRSLKGRRGQ